MGRAKSGTTSHQSAESNLPRSVADLPGTRTVPPRGASSHDCASPRSGASPAPSVSYRPAKNKIPVDQDQSLASIREVIRSELREFLVCEQFQAVLQDRVSLAFHSAGQSGVLEKVEAMLDRMERTHFRQGESVSAEHASFGGFADVHTSEWDGTKADSKEIHTGDEKRCEDDDDDDNADKKNFDRKLYYASTTSVEVEVVDDASSLQKMRERFDIWWNRLEEPPRTGWLSQTMRGETLELFMCFVVVFDVALMIYEADKAVSQVGGVCEHCKILDGMFQAVYTVELVLKLVVHGRWFFYNNNMRQNWFDFFLVITGFLDIVLVESGAGGNSIRIMRLARLGKALRALKVMSRIKHLQVFILCLQGSISPFFWATIMLAIFFIMFSLFFVKLLASALESNQTMSDDMEAMFGSVQQSMLTLFMAATGGEDWAVAYWVIKDVGMLGSFCYLLFISFVQLCLINIITGIFVDAAMQTLAPSAEVIARTRAEQEVDYAKELQRLCLLVDEDESGKLSPAQFEEGMHRGRIPMLLTMLGLKKDHVLDLFQEMSELHKHDQGQVDIAQFVACCMQMKGPATNFDLQKVMSKLETMQHSQAQVKKMTRKLTVSHPVGPVAAPEP